MIETTPLRPRVLVVMEEVLEHRRLFDCDLVYFDTSLTPRVDRLVSTAIWRLC